MWSGRACLLPFIRWGQLPTPTRTANLTGDVLEKSITFRRTTMTWTTPLIEEVCLGMEVTSYESAEILF